MIIGLAILGIIMNFILLILAKIKDLKFYHNFSLLVIFWSIICYILIIITVF